MEDTGHLYKLLTKKKKINIKIPIDIDPKNLRKEDCIALWNEVQ